MSDDPTSRVLSLSTSRDDVVPLHPTRATPESDEARMAGITLHLQPQLLRYAATLAGEADADDVVQEALLRYWRRLSRVGVGAMPTDVKGHLLQLVRDVALGAHRTERRRGRLLARVGGAVSAFAATHISSPFISGVRHWMAPARPLEFHELGPRLLAAIETLPQRQREVILLVYAHQLPLSQVADLLGVAPGSVRATVSAAYARLRVLLGGSAARPKDQPPRRTSTEAP